MTINAQDECKCNIQNVLEVKLNLDSLTPEILQNFFCTFDDSCKNNVEFSQFSNGMLFEVMNKSPQLLLEVLENQSDLTKQSVYEELESPIDDRYMPIDLIKKIDSETPTALAVIDALKIAQSKY